MADKLAEKPRQHAEDERKRIEVEEDEVTLNSDESFPASDPPSFNPGVTGSHRGQKEEALSCPTRHARP